MFGGPGKLVKQLDASQEADLLEITEMLMAAGYFRARIRALTPFDKIVGGMAWCISASNVDADIDVVFRENAKIGQKIKTGETIVSALRKLKCPYPLQSHQIQGLDFPNLVPVVRWLVKRAIETKKEMGDVIRKYSESRFGRQFRHPRMIAQELLAQQSRSLIAKGLGGGYQARKLRPAAWEDYHGSDMNDVVQRVLLEYGHRLRVKLRKPAGDASAAKGSQRQRDAEEAEAAEKKEAERVRRREKEMLGKMEDASSGFGKVSSRTVSGLVALSSNEIKEAASKYEALQADKEADKKRMKEDGLKRRLQQLEEQVVSTEAELASLRSQAEESKTRLVALDDEAAEGEASHSRIVSALTGFHEVENGPQGEKIKHLRTLIAELHSFADKQRKIEEEASAGEAAIGAKISAVKSGEVADEPEIASRKKAIADVQERVDGIRKVLARRLQQSAVLQRAIDDVPSRVELNQYQKRFVALYAEVAKRLEQTKMYFDIYNQLNVRKGYIKREIELLDSVAKLFPGAIKSKQGREGFLEKVEKAVAGVEASLEKVSQKKKLEDEAVAVIDKQIQELNKRQRAYFKTLDVFKEECEKNERLRASVQ